jgi:hypothetical protein
VPAPFECHLRAQHAIKFLEILTGGSARTGRCGAPVPVGPFGSHCRVSSLNVSRAAGRIAGLERLPFGARLRNTSAIITASEIIKGSATGWCSLPPPFANFTAQSSGAGDSEGCSATIIARGLICFDPIVGQYGRYGRLRSRSIFL